MLIDSRALRRCKHLKIIKKSSDGLGLRKLKKNEKKVFFTQKKKQLKTYFRDEGNERPVDSRQQSTWHTISADLKVSECERNLSDKEEA